MKFTEKNEFVSKHTSADHFSKDLELFKIHCPNNRLHADLKRVNSFNRQKLDGLMLWELLDKISPEKILKNREIEIIPVEETLVTPSDETTVPLTDNTPKKKEVNKKSSPK